jgi:hypothetical protein
MTDEDTPVHEPTPAEQPGEVETAPPSPGAKPRIIKTKPEIASLISEPLDLAPPEPPVETDSASLLHDD